MTNVLRHAGAGRCWIRLGAESGLIRLEVGDDGQGLRAPLLEGEGLRTMRERMAALGGQLEVLDGGGVRVVAVLPPAPVEVG